MLKKFSYVAAAGIMLAALAGCGPKAEVTLKVWQPQLEQELLAGMAADFQALHPEWDITFDFGVVEEPDLKTTLTVDVEAGADVFAFPDDQLIDLINAGALAEVQQFKSVVQARDVEWAVAAATKDGKLYAYPETADNGYYLYYDSSKLTATDVLTLDAILDKADDLNKSILWDPSGGWTSAAWFLNTGTITFDGTTQTCSWNDEAGLASVEGMWDAYSRERILSSGNHANLYADGSIIASVTGTWEAAAISAVLGENYAATKLPTFTNGDDEQQQLGSFVGAKLVGVNAYSDCLEQAHAFAEFITNETNQLERALVRGLGPSNLVAGASTELASNVALSALAAQAPYGVLQSTAVGGSFWEPMGALTNAVIDNDLGDFADLQAMLDAMVAQITATA
ncbi:MAG: extracellular solute-binding protein [Bacilli bacterium]|jgi:arabinogalactan oligomer/maltooligosaccharide transport system substrate-binding protein